MPVSPFLTAQWKNLLAINYRVAPETLAPYLPDGVELDDFDGEYFVSLVAFQFDKTKLLGLIPAFSAYSFEEINLRFYVRRKVAGEVRRGVVFIKEIVPSALVTFAARSLYGERYETRKTCKNLSAFDPETGGFVEYGFDSPEGRCRFSSETAARSKT